MTASPPRTQFRNSEMEGRQEEKTHGAVPALPQPLLSLLLQCCQMAKFDPFLSLDCARVEGVGAQSKERKGSNFAA